LPCKHLAATFYLLAEAFDADPFLLLRWRGRDREPLLARLRELRSTDPVPVGASDEHAVRPAAAGAALALVGVETPAVDLDRFWYPPPLPTRPPVLDSGSDLLLRQLPEPKSAMGGADVLERLRVAYERFGRSTP
jgi:uncharacterized Zn finger protein